MTACSPACGWCGRCTGAWEQPPEQQHFLFCDNCGKDIFFGAKSLQGVGVACSDKCLNALCLEHEKRMATR